MSQCAPHLKDTELTCFDKETLIRIAESINEKHFLASGQRPLSASKKKGKNVILTQGKTKKEIWEQIRKAMRATCKDNEICWAKATGINISEHFKPAKPKGGRYAWLSGNDIEDIMKQYEKLYKDFKFFGPLPSDFDKIATELKGQSLEKMYKRGIKRIGIILNTDPHNKPGQHWVAFFLDLSREPGSVEYYDSLGQKPFKSMREYMKNLVPFVYMTLNKDVSKKINTRVHQKKDGQCGVFSVAYIIKRLNGKTFEEIMKDWVMTDEGMADCRDYYFRSST